MGQWQTDPNQMHINDSALSTQLALGMSVQILGAIMVLVTIIININKNNIT